MVVGTHTRDFAEQNQHLISTYRDFKDLYTNHSKEEASKILWSAYYTAVITDERNPFKNFKSDDERREKIKEEFYKSYSQRYLNLEKLFRGLVLSKEHSLFNLHARKYEEFLNILTGLDLTNDTEYKKYIDSMSKLPKISEYYEELSKKYNESLQKNSSKEGGGKFTVAEKRNMSKRTG